MKVPYLGEGAKVKLIEMEASIHSCGKVILATDAASDLKVRPVFFVRDFSQRAGSASVCVGMDFPCMMKGRGTASEKCFSSIKLLPFCPRYLSHSMSPLCVMYSVM